MWRPRDKKCKKNFVEGNEIVLKNIFTESDDGFIRLLIKNFSWIDFISNAIVMSRIKKERKSTSWRYKAPKTDVPFW